MSILLRGMSVIIKSFPIYYQLHDNNTIKSAYKLL